MKKTWQRYVLLTLLGAAVLGSGGCELLYFAGGKGKQKALHKFLPTQKVLVLVDIRDNVVAPPYFAGALADGVGAHLFKYKAIEHLVPQGPLLELQTRNPDAYAKMGIADIAQAMGADVVLHVRVTQLATPKTTDGTVAEGVAEVYVKVIDSQGGRVFPGDTAGTQITARDAPAMTSDRDTTAIMKDLLDQLILRTGRMFHDYDMEDKTMVGHRING